MKNGYELECNIAQTLNLIGDKWSLLILHEILLGHGTYKEIQEKLEGIPTNLLATRLKELEQNKLIQVEQYSEHPPRYRYLVTESGEDLKDIFYSIILWGEKHLGTKCYKKLAHKKCKQTIQLQYYCPNCKEKVSEEEIETIKIIDNGKE